MNIALKEWAVVIEALARGRQRFLLRKGGIAEGKHGFEVKHSEFLLYPTWEHQHAESIRAEFRELFEQTRPKESGEVRFQYLAQVTDILRAPVRLDDMRALDTDHIWAPSYLEKRYSYRPDLPLFVVILRLYRLVPEGEIPEIRQYGGCRSWVNLDQKIDTGRVEPAESDTPWEKGRNSLLEKLVTAGARKPDRSPEALEASPYPR